MKTGDLVKIKWKNYLWSILPGSSGPGFAGILVEADEFVIVAENRTKGKYIKVLHAQHGLKWIAVNNLLSQPKVKKMPKPGDLAQIRANMSLWEIIGNNAGYRSVCQANKDDFVIIVEYTQGSTYTKILHNEHGLKWVVTNSLDILKRSEDV
jgi:hypothetical protein